MSYTLSQIENLVARLFSYSDIVTPLRDSIIKKLLGEPNDSEERLKSFLNAIRKQLGELPIDYVEILPVNNSPDELDDKETIMDIKARDSGGTWYNIEIQLSDQKHFIARVVFYGAQLHSAQLTKGQDYGKICPTICIVLTDFVLFPPASKIFHVFELRETTPPHAPLSNHLLFCFFQFSPDITANLGELDPDLADWIQLFNLPRTTREEIKRIMLNNATIAQTGTVLLNFVEKNYALLEAKEKLRRDRVAREEFVRDEGRAKGQVSILIKLVNRHLGHELPKEYQDQIMAITDPDQIENLALDLDSANTIEQVKTVLARYI